jgi:hypothetical protein
MRTSLQFFKDMGVCDGAYQTLQRVFDAAGVTEFDYDAGYQVMMGMMDTIESDAAQSDDPDHANAENWVEWCYDLRNRPEAIMYFGDHIEKNTYRTPDGLLHMSIEEAEASVIAGIADLRAEYAANHAVVGIKEVDEGEQWITLRDLDTVDWSEYDRFTWTDIRSGQRFDTPSATEALAHYAYMSGFYDQLEALKETQKASIKRLIADNSDTYEVWV